MTTVQARFSQLSQLSPAHFEVSAGHGHQWVRLPGAVGLFSCRDGGCLWCAVCPACLGSLDVALRAHAGIPGLVLSWCPEHGGQA